MVVLPIYSQLYRAALGLTTPRVIRFFPPSEAASVNGGQDPRKVGGAKKPGARIHAAANSQEWAGRGGGGGWLQRRIARHPGELRAKILRLLGGYARD